MNIWITYYISEYLNNFPNALTIYKESSIDEEIHDEYILNKIINATLLFLPPFFMSWTQGSKWLFIVASLRHTCALIMLSNQHLDMPHLWGGWIISAKEKCSLTQIQTDLWTIFERNRPFVYIEKVLDLWVQLMKNGGKSKSVMFIILLHINKYINNFILYTTGASQKIRIWWNVLL